MKRIKPNFIRRDKRGIFVEVCRGNQWKQLNFFTIKKGFVRGGHYHKRTKELFYVIGGRCILKILNIKNQKREEFIVKENDAFVINPYKTHYLKALVDTEIVVLLSLPHSKAMPDMHEPQE